MRFATVLALSLGGASLAAAQQTAPASAPAAGPTKQMQPADLKAWKTIRQSVLSNDGKWFAYVLAPNEGDANVIIRSTGADNKEWKFPIGSSDAGGRGGGGAGGRGGAAPDAGGGPLSISADSRWVAFTVYSPSTAGRGGRAGGAGRGGRGGGAPTTDAATQTPAPQNKLAVVNLATGEKKEFDRVRRYAFNGDKPTWLAIQAPAETPAATTGTAPATGARGGAGAGGAAAAGRAEGTDLLLYNLASGEAVNVGNVAEFGFDDSGEWLAYAIDARDQIGNGVQLRNMKTDVVRAIDSDRSLYRHLVWADSVDALAVLRGRVDSTGRDTNYSVVTFTGVSAPAPKKLVFDATQHTDFPKDMAIAVERAPRLAEDLSAVYFGIHEGKKSADRLLAGRGSGVIQAGAPGMGGTINQPRVNEATEENPSLIIWNEKDPRLQSQQIVQETQDRAFTFLAEYRLADDKFVQLADEALRSVTVSPHDHFAIGTDNRDYEQPSAYTGRVYEDDYTVDLRTGKRDLVLKKHRPGVRVSSPNGKEELYWGDDGNYWVLDLATGAKRNITKATAVNFFNTDDDHNYLVPPPRAPFGWTRDGASVLLSDGWDIWKVPTTGTGTAVNITVNGKRDQIRYNRVYPFERGVTAGGGRGGRGGRGGGGASPGIDLTQPLYVGAYGEWTKKAGLSRVDPGTPGAKSLVWDDASFDFQKARDADVYVYTKQSSRDFPNYFVAGTEFKDGRQLTDANPQQKEFAWTSGVRLINYTSAKGDKLQGALYLPANYEPGKKYPLLVTIYEKRSNLANTFVSPSETSTPNRSMYTSRGYAVLDPDIVYKINTPGMSAVWCVIPAVKAAIGTGMIDSANVGLWGHSWGGYQTAFLVTQTNIFKAAIAGAPLTNMVSMYASVYWNTGNSDASIFEDSQGRFKGNYTDNMEAYIRNSPNFHAKNVKTPLIILADDKDGAVDFNQGITYYNTLAQLKKDVILLEYVGENHGLARPINMKDYAMRQKDWFDHYLKGTAAPDWMTKGIPRIKMDEYWQSLKAQQSGSIVP